ncbi:hypothetical protein Agabi119p4_6343 [Agaricus bisporus var. burnettii]|nr:hypothetical protein Agabi119p4_6343 [Agaricus bisporus var. burnettii]
MDLLYFGFFASHLFASLLLDLQWLYPASLVPKSLRALNEYYIVLSGDPLMGALAGLKHDFGMTWFKTFVTMEAFFQVPVFILGLSALWKGSKKIYPLLLIYATSSATTTLPCLIYILSLPGPTPTTTPLDHTLTFEQRLVLLSGYGPFFLVPLIMVFDFGSRLQKFVSQKPEQKLD